MSDDMAFAEGCYRLEGGDWQVVTATKAKEYRPAGVRNNVSWDSGVTGMNIVLTQGKKINARTLLDIMSSTLCVSGWREVRGPDSMALR
jgi:hypothetical protein